MRSTSLKSGTTIITRTYATMSVRNKGKDGAWARAILPAHIAGGHTRMDVEVKFRAMPYALALDPPLPSARVLSQSLEAYLYDGHTMTVEFATEWRLERDEPEVNEDELSKHWVQLRAHYAQM